MLQLFLVFVELSVLDCVLVVGDSAGAIATRLPDIAASAVGAGHVGGMQFDGPAVVSYSCIHIAL